MGVWAEYCAWDVAPQDATGDAGDKRGAADVVLVCNRVLESECSWLPLQRTQRAADALFVGASFHGHGTRGAAVWREGERMAAAGWYDDVLGDCSYPRRSGMCVGAIGRQHMCGAHVTCCRAGPWAPLTRTAQRTASRTTLA